MTLNTPGQVRDYMGRTDSSQSAFLTVGGDVVLVVIDRDGDIGVVDPSGNISFRFLIRCLNMMPFTPMVPEGVTRDTE